MGVEGAHGARVSGHGATAPLSTAEPTSAAHPPEEPRIPCACGPGGVRHRGACLVELLHGLLAVLASKAKRRARLCASLAFLPLALSFSTGSRLFFRLLFEAVPS